MACTVICDPAGSVASDPDLRESVEKAIENLSEVYRTTLVMHDVEGYTHAEIAEVLDCSAKAVEMRLYRARQQLRERLEKTLALP